MLFVSGKFIAFFIIVSVLYFLIPQRWKILYLLSVSLIFYGYDYPAYALLLLGLTAVDYFIARWISGTDSVRTRNGLLILSLTLNLGALLFFKYANFLNDFLAGLLNLFKIRYQPAGISLLMPLGISFYTFTKIAYVVDVYRSRIKAEENLLTLAAFVTFFPNVLSGPIERAGHLIPKIKQSIKFDYISAVEGLRLILWGTFKKVVIADRLAIYVNQVYGDPYQYRGLVLIVATFFLSFQIYADFSGYTDIARGVARILGIDLFENFRQPYLSKSILEFWRRWHISLTTWIREYLFLPLSRLLLRRTHRSHPRLVEVSAYLIIMSVIGLWHGASWTFVAWGLLHGIYMSVESILNVQKTRLLPPTALMDVVKVLLTFSLVSFAWIFFRVRNFGDAWYILANAFVLPGSDLISPLMTNDRIVPILNMVNFFNMDVRLMQLLLAFLLIGVLFLVDIVDARIGLNKFLERLPTAISWSYYYGLSFAIILLGVWGSQQFLYFKF
jgi:alginate O-acetyltransferase complex protein AlgI